jgi:S1-C subfamily serine protease
VFPVDKSFIVLFEWDAPPGDHVLTAIWRQPDGQVGSMSPDVKMTTSQRELRCYWTYQLVREMAAGIWTVEVRVDGQPAGTHSFEIAGTEPPTPEPAPKRPPTLDEVFRAVGGSIVEIHKLDQDRRRIDSSTGFVSGNDRVVTSFQAIDGAARLQIRFTGGDTVETDEILAFSRNGDWVVLNARTGDRQALQLGNPAAISIGERLIVFDVEADARVIGGVNVSGRRTVPSYGDRIQFTPGISAEASGGPLLDLEGRVVGIVGGSVTPGMRTNRETLSASPGPWVSSIRQNAAVPVSTLPDRTSESGSRLSDLAAQGRMTPPISALRELMYAGTAQHAPKRVSDPIPPTVTEFVRRDPRVWVFSIWKKQDKLSRGLVSAKVFDEQNQVRLESPAKKISLSNDPTRVTISFVPAQLTAGVYRIDLTWEGLPVWRTFIRISE